MRKKSFYFGVLTGIALSFIGIVIFGLTSQNGGLNPIQYLDEPVSYENKTETSFKVFQVIDNAALATEASDKIGKDVMFLGNTVVVLGKNFYSDQVVTVKKPQMVGTYSYTNKGGMPMTVPIIIEEIKFD